MADEVELKAMEVIKQKEAVIDELNEVNKELLQAIINYKQIKARLWLDTDFEEVLDKKRPTVDEKKAYVTAHSLVHFEQREKVKYQKEILLKQLDLCDSKLEYL